MRTSCNTRDIQPAAYRCTMQIKTLGFHESTQVFTKFKGLYGWSANS